MVIQLLLAQATLERMAHTPVAYAAEVPVVQESFIPAFADGREDTISYWASKFNISATEMSATIQCESKFHPDAVGDSGTSFGLVQIHLPAHPDVTKKQALDPDFSIRWMAREFSKGNQRIWTCWRMIYGVRGGAVGKAT